MRIREYISKFLLFFLLAPVLIFFNTGVACASTQNIDKLSDNLDTVSFSKIDDLVNKILDKSDTTGASAVIISNDKTIFRSYGYADIGKSIKVDENSLFEIGSNSKAFTALGILYLEKMGYLSLSDPVKKYIPWFNVKYKGYDDGKYINSDIDLTIENLLHQTSGIPFKTIGNIPEGSSDDMLEDTVRTLENISLDFYPGSKHLYATINYDVLGLIIQKVSGTSYEEFMTKNILLPLGLNDTYVFRSDAIKTGRMSKGYKISFFSSKEYDAPMYRGNTPAGYFISSASDMGRWLKIQMGIIEVPSIFKEIIQISHMGATTVEPSDNYFYGGGWYIHMRGDKIAHAGSNPNFSSMVIMNPGQEIGICILTNLNSNAADYLATNILNIIENKTVSVYKIDSYKSLDRVFSLITIGSIVLSVLFLFITFRAFLEILTSKRCRFKLNGAKVAGILLAVPLLIFLGLCVYYLPNIIFDRLPWDVVAVWGSPFIAWGCIYGFAAACIFMLYILVTFNFPKGNEKGYLALAMLSIINGLTSALIIFTINESFNRNLGYSKELFIYFVFSLLFFVYSMKLIQGKLILITNEIIYDMRMKMISKIMNSSYQAIERIGSSRIFSGLNNDTSAISKMPEVVVGLVSDLLTLIFCLGFLLSKSIYAFIASVSIIVLNGLISYITGEIAKKYWEESRNIQDTFFGQISDLVYGIKELVLCKLRKNGFYHDIKKYARLSTDLNKAASIKILNYNIYNILMYNVIFGVVVFIFPIFMKNISVNELRENLFFVFYMIGPFSTITMAIPQMSSLKINYQRIEDLIKDLGEVCENNTTSMDNERTIDNINIKFSDVEYTYMLQDKSGEKEFVLGPINLEIKSGELTFITGGNGSGKSTLAKLIAGLYSPCKGDILVNGKAAGLDELNECFTAILSDFHLFKKLYGIDYEQNNLKIQELLDSMGIKDKVCINSKGEFGSLDLSTGQKKRLAFVISCMENKPLMLFDEWAAEQDPEFRHYFYMDLLPMLKNKGKGVIVVTHDDRYFSVADKLIKLECGILINDNDKVIA